MRYGETHDDTAIVQTPAIGNALRSALSLDAAGGLPLVMETSVQPVAIVADVRAQLTYGVRSYSCFRNVAAVAANFAKVALRCPVTAAAGTLLYIVPRMIRLRDVAGAAVYWRLGSGTPPVATDAPPRPLFTQGAAAGVGVLGGGADLNPVAPGTMQGIFTGTATTIEWSPPEMRLYPDPLVEQSLQLYSDTVNTSLIVDAIWDEYYR